MKPAARYVIYGQACFLAGLLICAVIEPHGLTANEGISYYGIYRSTILPYILALLGPAYFFIKTARQLTGSNARLMKPALFAMGLCTIGVMITPDSWGRLINDLHMSSGIVLFVLQLLLSFWLVWRLRWRWQLIALTLLELAAGIAAFIWLEPPHGYLLESQVVFQVAFAGVLLYTLKIMESGG